MKSKNYMFAFFALALISCGKSSAPKYFPSVENAGTDDPTNNPSETPGAAKGAMLTCSTTEAKSYKGFGNIELISTRNSKIPSEGDRYRVKPYSALTGEFTRVAGAVPASLTANAATFAAAPDRWYATVEANAVSLFTTYRVSYEAALTLAGSDPKFAAAPTDESATANCTSFARQAWNRLPTPAEIASCKKIALVETAAETDVKSRWAYALASVLTATGFVAY